MKSGHYLTIAALTIFPATLLQATTPGAFEYQWTGTTPGYSGVIYLDAPTSALAPHGGTINDVLPGSYVHTPEGTFTVLDAGLTSAFGFTNITWDQTRIDWMNAIFNSPTPIYDYWGEVVGAVSADLNNQGPGESIRQSELANGGLLTLNGSADRTGHWMAVPEPTTLSLAVVGLGLLGLRRGRRSH